MDYRGVIFDFNGTLFFDNDKHVKAWGAISQLLRNKGITDEELHEHFNGVPNKQIIQYMLGDKCTEDDIVKYSSLKEEYYRKFCKEDTENFHLVKGSEEYFDLLTGKKVPFTIASASIIAPSDIVYDDGTYENKIAMFKKAADVIKTDIKDCLIIEDSLSGIQNAYNSGCNMIIVIDSANKKDEYEKLPGVIKVIDDFTQI